jgi:hypothetical protein
MSSWWPTGPRRRRGFSMRSVGGHGRVAAASPSSFRARTGTRIPKAELVVELAVPLLEEAAETRVESVIGAEDPVEAVRLLLARTEVDEIIVSTLPRRVSHWLHRDVPSRLQALGLPVTVVTATQSERGLTQPR